jgi:hypothetical protein
VVRLLCVVCSVDLGREVQMPWWHRWALIRRMRSENIAIKANVPQDQEWDGSRRHRWVEINSKCKNRIRRSEIKGAQLRQNRYKCYCFCVLKISLTLL